MHWWQLQSTGGDVYKNKGNVTYKEFQARWISRRAKIAWFWSRRLLDEITGHLKLLIVAFNNTPLTLSCHFNCSFSFSLSERGVGWAWWGRWWARCWWWWGGGGSWARCETVGMRWRGLGVQLRGEGGGQTLNNCPSHRCLLSQVRWIAYLETSGVLRELNALRVLLLYPVSRMKRQKVRRKPVEQKTSWTNILRAISHPLSSGFWKCVWTLMTVSEYISKLLQVWDSPSQQFRMLVFWQARTTVTKFRHTCPSVTVVDDYSIWELQKSYIDGNQAKLNCLIISD